MVDAVRLRNLLSRLASRVDGLASYGQMESEAYLADEQGVDASKYRLVTAIEDALAVANHVIASEGYRAPVDYRGDSFPLSGAGERVRVVPRGVTAAPARDRGRA